MEDIVPSKVSPPTSGVVVMKNVDGETSARRAEELRQLLLSHKEVVARAHASSPTPPINYGQMSPQEQQRWNEKRKVIDAANRAYHLAVNAAVARHAAEDSAAKEKA